jgi:hypothetical protein
VVQTIEDGLRQIVMASRVLANHLLNANLTSIDTLSSDIGTLEVVYLEGLNLLFVQLLNLA